MISDGAPLAGTPRTGMRGNGFEVLVDRHHGVGRAQPQPLADQRERHRIQRTLELT